MTDQFSRALDEYGCSVVRECGDDNDDRKRWLDEMNKARAAVEAMYAESQAEVERLKTLCALHFDELGRKERRIEELRADAERYRWLRKEGWVSRWRVNYTDEKGERTWVTAGALDTAIDAVRCQDGT